MFYSVVSGDQLHKGVYLQEEDTRKCNKRILTKNKSECISLTPSTTQIQAKRTNTHSLLFVEVTVPPPGPQSCLTISNESGDKNLHKINWRILWRISIQTIQQNLY